MTIHFPLFRWTVTLTVAKKYGMTEFYDDLLRKGELVMAV